jgi:hypothetical protein
VNYIKKVILKRLILPAFIVYFKEQNERINQTNAVRSRKRRANCKLENCITKQMKKSTKMIPKLSVILTESE